MASVAPRATGSFNSGGTPARSVAAAWTQRSLHGSARSRARRSSSSSSPSLGPPLGRLLFPADPSLACPGALQALRPPRTDRGGAVPDRLERAADPRVGDDRRVQVAQAPVITSAHPDRLRDAGDPRRRHHRLARSPVPVPVRRGVRGRPAASDRRALVQASEPRGRDRAGRRRHGRAAPARSASAARTTAVGVETAPLDARRGRRRDDGRLGDPRG